MSAAPATPFPLFIGTYGRDAHAGIYRVEFDPATGTLSPAEKVAALSRPSFLCYSPDNRFLYALSASDDTVVAYAVAPGGGLTELNRQPTGFSGACFVATDRTGRMLLALSYGEAAVSAFPVAPDGALKARTSLVRHAGRVGPHAARQDKPHAHSVTISPDNHFAYVCDLGMDRIVAYRIDPATAALTPAPEADGVAPAGYGPRHSKITADGRFLYVVNELVGSVSVFEREPTSGRLHLLHTTSTLREGYTGDNTSSEIQLHRTEQLVYAANRGPDDLAVFRREPASQHLKRIQIIPTGGGHPRHFALSPDSRWLVCANRDGNQLVVFAVHPESGLLSATGHTAAVPEPVCVLFPHLP